MDETTFTITTADGQDLQVYRWAPSGTPRAVVQVQHGLGEHGGRYRRFAEALTEAGYLVCAPDSHASGRSAGNGYGVWGPDGWKGWVDDIAVLARRIHQDEPGLPLALFGHSLGSFGTQQFLLDHGDLVDAVVLSGTTEPAGMAQALGGDEPADLTSFNEQFEQRTGFEWLSRDADEVDRYVVDEACGWQPEPFVGIETLAQAADPERLAAIPTDLPVLIISGDQDPVAGPSALGPQVVGERYRQVGLTDVTVTLYPEARHELLNETNRDEVTADVLAFLDRTVG
ncbi:alpha/beta hydrolase [Luteococcus peritonei]|uniref:Alpha/beta hydrolase n=1 Tax=Luteococcus peritonei TaxID=88874 RepID=A0ABW4RZW0_9ACTN